LRELSEDQESTEGSSVPEAHQREMKLIRDEVTQLKESRVKYIELIQSITRQRDTYKRLVEQGAAEVGEGSLNLLY